MQAQQLPVLFYAMGSDVLAYLLADKPVADAFVAPGPLKMQRELCFEGAPDDRQALGRRHGRTSQVVGAVKLLKTRTQTRPHARMELKLTRWDVENRNTDGIFPVH